MRSPVTLKSRSAVGVGELMRCVIVRFIFAIFLIAASSFALMSNSADAQSMGGNPGGGGRKHQEQKSDKTAAQKPKADDKAYNAALKSLPNKPFDSWYGVR